MSFKKNTAVTGFPVGLVSATDGSAITTGTPVGYYLLDGGTQTAIADVTPVHEGNGMWTFNLTAAEMNGDIVGLTFTHASAITAHFTIKTEVTTPSDLNNFNPATDTVATVTNLTNLPSIPTNWITAAGIAASAFNGKGDWNIGKTGYSISGTKTTLDALNDIAATAIVSAGAITTLSGKVTNVGTVDTVTTNTDMRGTDGANTTAPDNASIAAILTDTGTTIPAQITALNDFNPATDTVATVTNLTNLPSIPTNWITAAGISASALNGKGDWNVGKTGYTLTQTFPTNFADMAITATTGKVTVGTNNDKTGYSISGTKTTLDALNDFDPALDTVAHVTLVDTTTTNTDMRGTDNANTVAPDNTSIASILVDTGTTLDTKLNDIQGGTFSSATDSLEAIRNRGDAAWTTGAGGTPPQLLQSTTIATLASQTSFTLTAGSADDSAYNGAVVVVTDSVTSTQKAVGDVLSYTGATKTITLSSDPGIFTMAAGDTIDVIANASSAPSASTVASAVWEESTAGHVTAGTYGKSVADVEVDTSTTIPAQITGLNNFNPATDTVATVTNLTNLPSIPTNWLTAAGISAGAFNGKGDWNIGKTGYTLSQTFPTNFADLSITATTGKVTVGTNSDKTGYSISGTKTTLDALNDIAVTSLNNFDPATDTVAHVTLVDTTTTNTDMRGTDGANTAAPDNASIAAILTDTGTTLPAQITALHNFDPATQTVDIGKIAGNSAASTRLALSASQIIPFTVSSATFTPTVTDFEASDITEATTDHFNGRIIIWTTGALTGQATSIYAYVLSSGKGKFTVVGMTEAPANGDTGVIV